MFVRKKLGEILLDANLVSKKQLQDALDEQERSGKHIGSLLVEMGYLNPRDLLLALEIMFRVPSVDLSTMDIPRDLIPFIPDKIAFKYQVIPVAKTGDQLTVAMIDPTDAVVINDIASITGMKVRPVVSPEIFIKKALERYYYWEEETAKTIPSDTALQLESGKVETPLLQSKIEPVSSMPSRSLKTFKDLLEYGIEKSATHLHIEPMDNRVRIRFRIDGNLREMDALSKSEQNNLMNEIKKFIRLTVHDEMLYQAQGMLPAPELRSGLPQTGKTSIKIGEKAIMIDVFTYPTLFGERVVVQFFYQRELITDLSKIGMTEKMLESYKSLISQLKGVIFVVGPPNSGKRSTLYASISYLNSPTRNVFVLEHPIEYQLSDISQGKFTDEIAVSPLNLFKSALKQDPDVILIRDIQSIELMEAVLHTGRSGKLIFTTMETDNSYSLFQTLMDRGIKPSLIASSVRGVLYQRLVRKLCPHCKEPYVPSDELLSELRILSKGKRIMFYNKKGCEKCQMTGFIGMAALFELLIVDDKIEKLIKDKASPKDIKKTALESGMIHIDRDGLIKVYLGITTLDEVLALQQI